MNKNKKKMKNKKKKMLAVMTKKQITKISIWLKLNNMMTKINDILY